MKQFIYIVRHCQAEGQAPDASLTEEGFEQAEEVAQFFAQIPIDEIISSPFKRAIQTITPYATAKNVDIKIDNRLSERTLSSISLDDWMEKLRETYIDLDLKFEGGESSREAMNRIVDVINEISTSAFENTIIVTHGNIMSLLLNYYDENFGFAEWKQLSNPDIYLLTISERQTEYKRVWG
mgnify:CR=1 FL=1